MLCGCSGLPLLCLLEHDLSASGQLRRQLMLDG